MHYKYTPYHSSVSNGRCSTEGDDDMFIQTKTSQMHVIKILIQYCYNACMVITIDLASFVTQLMLRLL